MLTQTRTSVAIGTLIVVVTLFLVLRFVPITLTDEAVSTSYTADGNVLDKFTTHSSAMNIRLPFSGFIQNRGQMPNDMIRYYYSTRYTSIGFSPSIINVVSFSPRENTQIKFSISFPGAETVIPAGKDKNQHAINYFYGKARFTDVPSYNEIWYEDLYPGIDLRYYMSAQGLKYDFIVHPGADPAEIAIEISDPMVLSIEDQNISMYACGQPRNICFQDTGLQTFQEDGTEIHTRFIPKDNSLNTYGFQLSSFDPTQTLIIDPLVLVFSTFLGGNGYDEAYGIMVDIAGNSYITGQTTSSNFPMVNAYNSTYSGNTDAFIAKLDASGTGLVFTTYLGGSADDFGYGIAVDAFNNSYITGYTASNDYPMHNAYNSTFGSGYEVFVTKINATGNGLVYSTYLGGSADDFGYGIAVDVFNNSYITGATSSSNFPMVNAYNNTYSGASDAFVTKLNATGTGLSFSTYLGGSSADYGYAITVDIYNSSYVTGGTSSADFPILNAYQISSASGYDTFVTKFDPTGTTIRLSTYLGGGGSDYGRGIAVDSYNNSYITGYTSSTNFPTYNAYQDTFGSGYDAFITKINATGNGLVYSTYFGGTGSDRGYGIIVDSMENVYITGFTGSSDFPIQNAYQSDKSGNNDVFVAKLNKTGTSLVFSTYLGGDDFDGGRGIAADDVGNIYITGRTASNNFPIVNAYNSTYGGSSDVFVVKFTGEIFITLNSPTNASAHQSSPLIDLSITAINGVSQVLYNWDNLSNLTLSEPYDVSLPTIEGFYVLRVYVNDTAGNWVSKIFTFTIDRTAPIIALISPSNNSRHESGTTIDLSIIDPNNNKISLVLYNWDSNANVSLSSPFNLNFPIVEGQHVLHVYVNDTAGNWASVLFIFTTDDGTLDTDSDGLPDWWEILYNFDPKNSSDRNLDPDGDDLSNFYEYSNSTDPWVADTDGDGLPDGWEVKHQLNPGNDADASFDPDNDGLTCLEEYNYDPRLDPQNADTDGDNIPDGWEIDHQLNPLSHWDSYVDRDGDGLTNLEEYQLNTDPHNRDTDGDGLYDNIDPDPLSSNLLNILLGLTVLAGFIVVAILIGAIVAGTIQRRRVIEDARPSGLEFVLSDYEIEESRSISENQPLVPIGAASIEEPLQENKCIICQLVIKEGINILSCPFCGVKGHPGHFREWLRTKAVCPNCRHELREDQLIAGIIKEIEEPKVLERECWACQYLMDLKQAVCPKCGMEQMCLLCMNHVEHSDKRVICPECKMPLHKDCIHRLEDGHCPNPSCSYIFEEF
ncbi:MAG: SBBP repeat-containing protein [Promethearchaeota archaeon]